MKLFYASCLAVCILSFSSQLVGEEAATWTPDLTRESLVAKATAGDPYFQALFGIHLRAGENGMKVDYAAARKWSQKAAQAGNPLGLYNLGNLALWDNDLEKSSGYYQDAQLLLARKASGGGPVAQFAMGEICLQNFPKDSRRAVAYFKESAAAGYPLAQATLGVLYLNGYPPARLPKDERKGITLLVEAVRQQSMISRFNLGMAYYNGEGVPKDNDRAIRWLRLAAEQNFAEAQYSLAVLLRELDSSANKHEWLRLLQRAANQNHTGAAEDLRKSLGPQTAQTQNPNPPVTVPMQNTPEQQRLAKEQRIAGQRYYNGQNTKQDFEKAYTCFKKAAGLGDAESQRYLALLLFHGKGCAKDRKLAGNWLRQAASKGDLEARRILTTFAHFFRE